MRYILLDIKRFCRVVISKAQPIVTVILQSYSFSMNIKRFRLLGLNTLFNVMLINTVCNEISLVFLKGYFISKIIYLCHLIIFWPSFINAFIYRLFLWTYGNLQYERNDHTLLVYNKWAVDNNAMV